MKKDMPARYSECQNKLGSVANGVDYTYCETGEGPVPLVLLQHFRGNLDNWDPALIDALAADRRVVTFDNAGVGGGHRRGRRTPTQPGRLPGRVLHPIGVQPASRPGNPAAHERQDRRQGQGHHLADPAGPVRRGVRLGDPGPCPAAPAERHQDPGVRGQRGQRPDDPAALHWRDFDSLERWARSLPHLQ
jgi:hypothetical protein